MAFGRQAAWRPGAIVVGPCRQAAWWHGAVAVELLGGDCKGLGLCFARGLNKIVRRQGAWVGGRRCAVKLLGGKINCY